MWPMQTFADQVGQLVRIVALGWHADLALSNVKHAHSNKPIKQEVKREIQQSGHHGLSKYVFAFWKVHVVPCLPDISPYNTWIIGETQKLDLESKSNFESC